MNQINCYVVMPSDLPPAPSAAVSAAGGVDASVVDTIFTSTIRSSKKGKHPILSYLEIYANFELQRSYTPASVKKIVPPSSQHWAKIRPANSALHTFGEGRELSWGVATPTSRMAQYLVGNPTKNKLCTRTCRPRETAERNALDTLAHGSPLLGPCRRRRPLTLGRRSISILC